MVGFDGFAVSLAESLCLLWGSDGLAVSLAESLCLLWGSDGLAVSLAESLWLSGSLPKDPGGSAAEA
jgi:hypothetical protein